MPGREGPKHRAVAASVPLVPGWKLPKGLAPPKPRYSKTDLALELQQPTARTEAFREQVRSAVVQATADCLPLPELNQTLLRLCQQHYPLRKTSIMRPGEDPAVTEGIREMWRRHRALKTRQAGSARKQVFSAWIRYRDFMRAWRALRAISRNARKRWLESQVTQAEEAAGKHDMRTVYKIIQRIAPKRRYEPVHIRGDDGRLLNKNQQFQALLAYFRAAFGGTPLPDYESSCADPHFTLPEIELAIRQLKNAKAVPAASPTAEVWKHCSPELAVYFQTIFQHSRQVGPRLPQPMTDCTLALLPKPQKPLRRPQDLRPLGLQDLSSKVLAGLVRYRLQEQVQDWLASKPQFAYIAGRSGMRQLAEFFSDAVAQGRASKRGLTMCMPSARGCHGYPAAAERC